MSDPSMQTDMQTLLAHQNWVRELAQRLVRDPDVAEDVAQEAFLAALEGRSVPRSPRAWLAAVVKNLVWERFRGEARRRGRETGVARGEAVPSTAEVVERVSVHRALVGSVMELPEHYQVVLLRRYFEGETPTEIARHLEVPLSTVKTRLARGLALLRDRLDQEHGGDGRAWLSALTPLLFPAEPARRLSPLVLGLGTALVSVGLAVVAWRSFADPPAPAPLELPPATASPPLALEPVVHSDLPREALAPTQLSESQLLARAERTLGPESGALEGRVLDADGRPLAGVLVGFRSDRALDGEAGSIAGSAIALTDSAGGFRLSGTRGTGVVRAVSDEHVTIVGGEAHRSTVRSDLLVVVAPRRRVGGRVETETGVPIAGASIRWQAPRDFPARLGSSLEHAAVRDTIARCDPDGRFPLTDFAVLSGASLVVSAEGFADRELALPEYDGDLEPVVLSPRGGSLRGVVLGPEGRPVPGARVSTRTEFARSETDGSFALEVGNAHELVALAAGVGAATLAAPRDAGGEVAWGEWVELRLASPRRLAGRVITPDGRPLAGVQVGLSDPTVFRLPARGSEGLTATGLREEDRREGEFPELLESSLLGTSVSPWIAVATDAEGRFRIEGLLPRAYGLTLFHAGTLSLTELGPFEPRDGLELVLAHEERLARVEGVVRDRRGNPVQGVDVSLSRRVATVRFRGAEISSQLHGGARCTTDAAGRYVLAEVPARGVHLDLAAPSILPRTARCEDSVIEVELRARVQVLEAPGEADAFHFLDVDGEPLPLVRFEGARRSSSTRGPLVNGSSEVLATSDAAVRLQIFRGEALLLDVPVDLVGGSANEIRP